MPQKPDLPQIASVDLELVSPRVNPTWNAENASFKTHRQQKKRKKRQDYTVRDQSTLKLNVK